jgi:two-component system NtrC family sensor kinase
MLCIAKISSQRRRTLLFMLAGVVAVVVAGVWDGQRQSARGLAEIGREHSLLAMSLAALPDEQLARAIRQLEATEQVAVLLREPNGAGFQLSNGKTLLSNQLDTAFASQARSVVLPRSLAATIGLEARTAVAGIAPRISTGSNSADGVVVVESAASERDRARHSEWRAVLMVLLVSLLIIGFGLAALRRQRRELALRQKLRINRAEHARDVELSRANRMATVAALASGFAHEIATPLGVIVGRVEQLRAAVASDGKATRFLDAIAAQTEHIDRVIRGFLGLTRGDAPAMSSASVTELAHNAADLVRHRFEHSKIELQVDEREGDGARVLCNPTLFGQVLVNALINALEASEAEDSVCLAVRRSDRSVEFSIIDQGQGIALSAIAQVTEPFFTTKATRGGTGLGLAIAKEIVTHHHGKLSLARRADLEGAAARGTRVTVQLPLAEDSQ